MTQFQISADVALHLGNLLLHKDTIGLKGKGGKTANLHETYHAHMLLGNTVHQPTLLKVSPGSLFSSVHSRVFA